MEKLIGKNWKKNLKKNLKKTNFGEAGKENKTSFKSFLL